MILHSRGSASSHHSFEESLQLVLEANREPAEGSLKGRKAIREPLPVPVA